METNAALDLLAAWATVRNPSSSYAATYAGWMRDEAARNPGTELAVELAAQADDIERCYCR